MSIVARRGLVWGSAVLVAMVGYFWLTPDPVSPPPELSMPPEEDCYVSFLQSAYGVATGLKELKSHDQLLSSQQAIDQTVEELNGYRRDAEALPAETRQRLAGENAELIQRIATASRELQLKHDKHPEILGNRWEQYWSVLQSDELTVLRH
jgi:hypothetical protein